MYNFSEVVLINNILKYYVKGQLHIFVTIYWFVKINFWYVCTQKSAVRCWYGAIGEDFRCCDICFWSCDFTRLVNYIYSSTNYCYVGFRFLWFDVKDYYSICYFTVLWGMWFWNEEYCIWSSNYVSHNLRKYD